MAKRRYSRPADGVSRGEARVPSDEDWMVRTTYLLCGNNQNYDYRVPIGFIWINCHLIPTSCGCPRCVRIPRWMVQQQKYCLLRGFIMDWISFSGRYTQLFYLLNICCFGSSSRNSLLRAETPNKGD